MLVIVNYRKEIEDHSSASEQKILLFDLETINQLRFDFNPHIKRFRTKMFTNCHVMLHSSLKLVLPIETYLPVSITTIEHTLIRYSTVELLIKHFDTKFTGAFALFFHIEYKLLNICKSSAKVHFSIIFLTTTSKEN